MSKTDNLHDYLSDLADAIREKKGTTEPINAQSFAEEIRTIESGNGWTGHADVEGLKAIGWDDEDIAYYQKYGVNWNAEDDEYHKVSDDNKALYGVLTASNIQTYRDRIVYLPKIDFSGLTSMAEIFQGCVAMIAVPMLNTSNVTNMSYMFHTCRALACVPKFDTHNVTNMSYMFVNCSSLTTIPHFDTSNVLNMNTIFNACPALKTIPLLNTSKVNNMSYMFNACRSLRYIPPFDTNKVTGMNFMFLNCSSLRIIPHLDCQKVTQISTFSECYSLTTMKLENIKISLNISYSALLSKESLLYIINNEAATSDITITLHSYAYQRLAEDADIVAALANHPLISLASA